MSGGSTQSREELAAQRQPLTVLVAEDEVLVRLAIAEHLRARGFLVFEANDGEEAIRLLQTYADVINVVFSDIRMTPGGTDGVGLALWVNTNLPKLPVVLTSAPFAYQPPQGAHEGKNFFRKPYNVDAVTAQLTYLALQHLNAR